MEDFGKLGDLNKLKQLATDTSLSMTEIKEVISNFNTTKENCENHLRNLAARYGKRKLPPNKWLRESKKKRKKKQVKKMNNIIFLNSNLYKLVLINFKL